MTAHHRTVATCLAVVAGLALGAAGCSSPGDPLAAAGCDPLERPQLQEGSHLIGDQEPPIPYTSSPPTSGWHSSGRPLDAGAYVEPISDPQLVRVLEQGGVVVAHDPGLAEEQVAELQRLPAEVDGIVVTPYPDAPGPVTLTAWGVLQRCEDVTAEQVAAFRDAHAQVADE